MTSGELAATVFSKSCVLDPLPSSIIKQCTDLLLPTITNIVNLSLREGSGADPGYFLGGGALVSCSTSTPINHIVFFCRIPVVLENRRSSRGGGGAHPLHPPPRSAPEAACLRV